ncbi:hypothetical protein LCGC14_2912580 [marine sediment metagenome]|uniref:Uncharacterized protein n=1 Tax=marine sediment metagenome TaxID=412755 RepID=A0A0F8XRJ8_9ZZZZ
MSSEDNKSAREWAFHQAHMKELNKPSPEVEPASEDDFDLCECGWPEGHTGGCFSLESVTAGDEPEGAREALIEKYEAITRRMVDIRSRGPDGAPAILTLGKYDWLCEEIDKLAALTAEPPAQEEKP